MSKMIHFLFLSAGIFAASVQSGLAANDCRLSGTWVSDDNDSIFTFGMIQNGEKQGKFTYVSRSWNLSYAGNYSLDDAAKLHLAFDGRDLNYKITMSPPSQPSLLVLEGAFNPAMPQGPQQFHEQSKADRILNFSLCNP
jgi:hypothetical protein